MTIEHERMFKELCEKQEKRRQRESAAWARIYKAEAFVLSGKAPPGWEIEWWSNHPYEHQLWADAHDPARREPDDDCWETGGGITRQVLLDSF